MQALGIVLDDLSDLYEALQYPVIFIPLSMGNPGDTPRQGPKNAPRNNLTAQSNIIETQPPFQAR